MPTLDRAPAVAAPTPRQDAAAQTPAAVGSNAVAAAGVGSAAPEGTPVLDAAANHELGADPAAALEVRIDGVLARSAGDPRGALSGLLAVTADASFPHVDPWSRARVLYDIGAAYSQLERGDDARIYFEAAMAAGGLDPMWTARAAAAIRRLRGGEVSDSAAPAEAGTVSEVEARLETAVQAAIARQNAQSLATVEEAYRSADFPTLPRGLRGRIRFALAAAYQNAEDYPRAISGWNEAIGSGELDAEHAGRASDNLRLARVRQPAGARPDEVLFAMIDGATALGGLAGREMLLSVYNNVGFPALPAEQRARVLFNIAALSQDAKQFQLARNFWLEALNAGVLNDRQQARARRYLEGALPNAVPATTPLDEAEGPVA